MDKQISRRDVIKSGVVAGVAFKIGLLETASLAQTPSGMPISTGAYRWWDEKQGLRFRIDALAKVTGEKSFARDFRAKDIPGWPKEQSHAFLIRATKCDRTFEAIDLSVLDSAGLQPDKIVVAEDLQRDDVELPNTKFFGEFFFVPRGQTPRLLGEPVAMLIYRNFDRYDAAKRLVRFNEAVVRYGAVTGPKKLAHYGGARYVRIGGEDPAGPDQSNPFTDGAMSAKFDGDQVAWTDAKGRGLAGGEQIDKDIAGATDAQLVLKREYNTQYIDASAMEADNGNAWFDAENGVLHAVAATQSPYELGVAVAEMVAHAKFGVKNVDLRFAGTVGYGTKDGTILSLFSVLAALYGDGRPVRLANDRFEQFQMGMKAHAFKMNNTLVVDKDSGKFQVLKTDHECRGGGRPNYSLSVGLSSTKGIQSAYYFPKSDLAMRATASRAVEAGSTRGYGLLQANVATELMVDEVADTLGLDAIDLRLRNVLRAGMKNTHGNVLAGVTRYEEILLKAKEHPLWAERAARKKKFDSENPGKKYGVGFAIAVKSFASSGFQGAATAALELSRTGEISLRHCVHEIGTGSTTTQAMILAKALGKLPDHIHFSVADWPELPLKAPTKNLSPSERELALKNPRYTPFSPAPMSATNSVHTFTFASAKVADTFLRLCVLPAANAVWTESGNAEVRLEDIKLESGTVTTPGREPLSFPRIAAAAHAKGTITAVSIHTLRANHFYATAEFDIPEIGAMPLDVDGLAVKYGDDAPDDRKAMMSTHGWHFIERTSVSYPPPKGASAADIKNYTGKGALVELVVNTATGDVSVLRHHSILECGTGVIPELVSGQIQGGVAMGIGYALHEYLPPFEDGPGDGTWNWNRYHLPRASDVAVWTQTADILPPSTPGEPPKGIAELTMMAIIPAASNAITHALGKRFYDLPVTSEKIRELTI